MAPPASVLLVSGARLATILHAAATPSKVAIDRPFNLPLGHCMETLPLANAKAAGAGSAAMVRAPNHLPAIPLGTKHSIHLMCSLSSRFSMRVGLYRRRNAAINGFNGGSVGCRKQDHHCECLSV